MFIGLFKVLDEDEIEFLDVLEMVSMVNCGGDMGMINFSWGFFVFGGFCFVSLDRMLSRLGV